MRNKFSRDKKKIKSKKVSGAGTSEVTQAVKEASEIYPFLKWLEPYIKQRKTVSNYKPVYGEEELNEDTEEESRPVTPASKSESDHPSTSSTSRYCREHGLKWAKFPHNPILYYACTSLLMENNVKNNSCGTMRCVCCFLVAKQRTTYIVPHA